MTTRDRWRWLLVGVLAVGVGAAMRHGRHVRRVRAAEQFAARTVAHAGETEACLMGRGGVFPDSVSAVAARARSLALGQGGAPGWPRTCADTLDELLHGPPRAAEPEPEADAVCQAASVLYTALDRGDERAAVAAFREGRAGGHPPGWAAALVGYHRAVEALGHRHGAVMPMGAPPRSARAGLPTMSADVVPVPLRPGSSVIASSYAAGTLSVVFIDPSRGRVFCRTRDRGVSIRCNRVTPGNGATAITLVGHDRPEALVLVQRGESQSVEAMDTLGTALFPLGAPASRTLGLRVSQDVLFAMVDTPAGPALERIARGGARAVREPAGVTQGSEAVMLAPGGAWWLASATDQNAPVLVARSLSPDLAVPAGDLQRVTALHGRTALVYGCQAEGVGYAAVADTPGGVMVAVEATGAPRVMGTLDTPDLPAELVCDATGATLVGATTVQSCARQGGCSPVWHAQGVHRVVRQDGHLVEVRSAEGGGLRVRRGAPAEMATVTPVPVADDAAHGGVDATDLWVMPAGDHLVLMAIGETNVVLWSGDQGLTWHPSRETGDVR